MSSKFLNLEGLKECIDRENYIASKEHINNIAKFFDEDLTKPELDLALEVLFNPNTGTLSFLKKTLYQRNFKDSNVLIFDLWIKLIQNHGKDTNFTPYVNEIVECCKKYILLTSAYAKERERATVVLQGLYENNLVDDSKTSDIVTKCLDVFRIKGQPGTFIQEICKLLGIISKNSPVFIYGENEKKLRDAFMKILEDILLNEENIQYNLLTGAMEGLNLFLYNFAPSPTASDDENICERLYACIKKLSHFSNNSSKAPFRAALDVFKNHAHIFSKKIYNDFNYWNDCLEKWISSPVYEDQKIGMFAINSFHQVIAENLNEIFQNYQQTEENYQQYHSHFTILDYLMNRFRRILESSSSKPYERRIAIRSFGLLSGLCMKLRPNILKQILTLVIQRTELISFSEDHELRDILEYFPDYIQALSQMIVQIQDKHTVQILSQNIQNITIRLIRDFYYLSHAHTSLVVTSLCNAFYNLSQIDTPILDNIIEKIILQGIIWTCSYKIQYDPSIEWTSETDWKENVTYKHFMPLWKGLLYIPSDAPNDRKEICKKVFNCLISTLFQILDKLNLQIRRQILQNEQGQIQELYSCDPDIDLSPVHRQDFHIFINLVDLYRDIFYMLPEYHQENFNQWINEYCTRMFVFIQKHPLISGFLKLFECALKIADRLHYFHEEENHDFDSDKSNLYSKLTYFLQSLIEKSKNTSGELQISSLELLLNFPIQIYRYTLVDMIPILKITFDLGRSMLWLAKISLSFLEKIITHYQDSHMDLKRIYEEILPDFDSYLQSKDTEYGVENLKSIEASSSLTQQRRQRIRRKFIKKINETELLTVQKRILSFLGKIEPQETALMIKSPIEFSSKKCDRKEESLVKWDIQQNVRLILYLTAENGSILRPMIFLDNIIPRMCHLAIESSDRQTKITACELIHAIVLYLIGTHSYQGQVWKELCKKLLILGSDSDITAQQLFKPLLCQLMHFIAKPEHVANVNLINTLIDSVMDGITNSTNSAQRDLSATCLREFVEWSLKLATPQQLEASPANIKIILQQNIKMLCFDSNASKRSGAALAFNNLYSRLREEESICNIYFVDLLYSFCNNYKLSEEFNRSLPLDDLIIVNSLSTSSTKTNHKCDLDAVSMSLDHIVRVLKERDYLFNQVYPNRIKPEKMGLGLLKDIVLFLFAECKTKLTNYRQKCIEMIKILVPRVKKISSIKEFIEKFMTYDELYEICEGNKDGIGIRNRTNLDHIRTVITNTDNTATDLPHHFILSWLEYFLGSLDCYCWLLSDEKKVLANPEKLLQYSNKIFQVIHYYFEKICWNSMYEILESINPEFIANDATTTVMYSCTEKITKIESIKCIIVYRIMNFLKLILKSPKCFENLPNEFWNENQIFLIKLFIQIIFEPHYLNFDFRFENVSKELLHEIEKLLRSFAKPWKKELSIAKFSIKLRKEILENVIERFKSITENAQEIMNSDRISDKQFNVIYGLEFLMKNWEFICIPNELNIIHIEKFLKISAKKLINDLFVAIKQTIFGKQCTVEPVTEVKNYGNKLLRFCFMIDDVSETVIEYILNENQLDVTETSNTIKHGEHFYNIYKKAIFEQCKTSFMEKIFEKFFSKMNTSNVHYIHRVIIDFLEFINKYRSGDYECIEKIIDIVLLNIEKILQSFNDIDEDSLVIQIISELAKMSPYPLTTFKEKSPMLKNWIFSRLKNSNILLEQKSKVICLLPLLIGPENFNDEEITAVLENLQKNHFPLRSNEFKEGSLEETSLKMTFRALLCALNVSKSFIILDFIIKCTAPDPNHKLKWMIREELQCVIMILSTEQQITWLNKVFQIACDIKYEPEIRYTIAKRFLTIMMTNSKECVLFRFLTENFSNIQKLVEINYEFTENEYETQNALVNRIIGLIVVEFITVNLNIDKLKNDFPEFFKTFSRFSHNARKENFKPKTKETMEFYRLYQCAAFKTLCVLISNTKKEKNDLHFYDKIIFAKENRQKNEYIWHNLFDLSKEYIFQDQQYEKYLPIKERFVSIRQVNASSSSFKKPQSSMTLSSAKLLRTQNVFQSSLSQDVNCIDFNNIFVRTDSEALASSQMRTKDKVTVYLERHDLNKHEVMPTLCGVVHHIFENGITTIPKNPKSKPSDDWINNIADIIRDSQNHKNVRIFFTQLVDNCRDVFQYYSYKFFEPILHVLVDECAGNKLNCFITDMITLLLSWTAKDHYKPTSTIEINLVSKLLKFVMKNAWHERTDIFKLNIELISTMLRLWKDNISIPSQLLYDMITRTNRPDSRDNECGIILMGLVLTNNLIPWTTTTKNDFIQAIFMNLNNQYTSIYQPAAHVFGMILNQLKINNNDEQNYDDTFDKWQYELKQKLAQLKAKKDNKSEKIFMDIIYNVQKTFTEIIDSYLSIIAFKIPKAIDTIKRVYLEMLLSRIEYCNEDDGIYGILISIGIKDLLRNFKYQLYALHIINKSLPKLIESEIDCLFDYIEECCYSKLTDNREIAYEIMIFILMNYQRSTNIWKKSNILLIKGLSDPEIKIQKRIFNCWSQEANLPLQMHDRIKTLMSSYTHECDEEFLGFCTQMLLELSIQHSESKRQIFQFETDNESKLIECTVDTTKRIKSTFSMPPLFTNKILSQHTNIQNSMNFIGDSMTKKCETVDGYFEPTQDPIKMSQIDNNFTLPTSSSLPFAVQSQFLDRRSQKLQTSATTTENVSVDVMDRIFNNFRKRILKNKENDKRTRALKSIDNVILQERRIEAERKRKEGQVILYRRYRYGDYPDLLINNLAILLPLQGLVKRDPIIARQIFVSIFYSIVHEIPTSELLQEFLFQIGLQIEDIFANPRFCEPVVFAAFMEIALMKPQYFKLSPESISTVAEASNMLTIGAVYLEHRISYTDWDNESTSTRTTSTVLPEDMHWLHLSDIYNSLAEHDIVASIFADKIRTDPRLSEAIDLKSNGIFDEAQKKLFQVIENNISIEQHYAYNCYFDCYIELGDWQSLSNAIIDQIKEDEQFDFDALWNDNYNRRFLLPKLMQAELKLALSAQTQSKEFLEILGTWMKDPIKSEYMKRSFGEELMMLHVSNQQFLDARVYCENYLKIFIFEWSIISSFCDKLRLQNLLNAQKVSEIDHYAYLMLNNLNENSIDLLINRWKNCSIDLNDSLKFWNSVISYRTYIAALITATLENCDSETVSTTELGNTIFNMDLQYFNAAIHQKNYGLVNVILNRLKSFNNSDSKKQLHYEICQIRKNILRGQRSKMPESFEIKQKAWHDIKNILNDSSIKDYIDLHIETLNISCQVGEEILQNHPNLMITNEIKEQIEFLTDKSNSENIYQRIFDQSLWSLKESVKLSDKLINSPVFQQNSIKQAENVEITKEIAKTNYRLAQFCYDFYNHDKINKSIEILKLLIESNFKAMKYNSKEAIQLFACILSTIENGELNDYFRAKSNDVPIWMYLSWIPQILSRLEFDKECYVDDIIMKIAENYPNALVYAFNLWCDRFRMEFHKQNLILRDKIHTIINLLKNPLIDKFIRNLKILCIPEQLLISHLEDFMKDILGSNTLSQGQYIDLIDRLIQTIFFDSKDIQGSSYGRIQIYQTALESLKELNLKLEHKLIRQRFREIRNKLIKSMEKSTQNHDIQLDTICPWLASFQWCGEEEFIELPGQYSGDYKPNILHHIKIVKFDCNIKLFKSQRCPLKFTIYGSDAKRKDFLIKFGEDLKQDQRIQQILKLMSQKLSNDQHFKHHNLFIRTFEVVPIHRFCGILSWVYDTKELFDFIMKYLPRHLKKINSEHSEHELIKKIQYSYANFIREISKDLQLPEINNPIYYGKAVTTYTRAQIINNFRCLENEIDLELLKYAFVDISMSPESFFVLRNNFAKSLATMNIAHWILGIGDRHLQNILINVKNCSLIGIDFNCTFGTATRNLLIPELIPFRLTPHLVNSMNPFGTSGFIFKNMVHALRVFRNCEKLLLACMEVFIREPNVDWVANIKKNVRSIHEKDDDDDMNETDDVESTTSCWEPKDRIDIAKCKLLGHNPMHLIERELKVSDLKNRYPEFIEGYIKLLRGHRQFNIRTRTPEENLNVETQVKCLIDLATDPAILGITYEGFMPWM